MGTARDELLAKVMDHVATHGLADASLREIADAVGTSHRMLIYHFGGRDGLVAAIVEAMEAQQRALLVTLRDGAASPAEVVRAQWKQRLLEHGLPQPSVEGYDAVGATR